MAVATNDVIFSPSILAADLSQLEKEVAEVSVPPVSWLHVDVMDGHFVPNLTMGPSLVESLRPKTKLVLDCHLMVTDPDFWIEPFIKSGADFLTFHIEAKGDPLKTISKIKSNGKCKAAITLNPATPLLALSKVLDHVDMVLVMGVNPGFAGQSFIESTTQKIKDLEAMRNGRKFLIQVDGGVGKKNIVELRRAGAQVFVAGSAIFGAADRKKAIQELYAMIAKV